MTLDSTVDYSGLSLSNLRRIDELCARFEAAWQSGQEPRAEDYLAELAEPERAALLRALLLSERKHFSEQGLPVPIALYRERFSEYSGILREIVGDPAVTQVDFEGSRGTNHLALLRTFLNFRCGL